MGVSGPTRRLRFEVGNILKAATGDGTTHTEKYDGENPVEGLLNVVRREYNMDPGDSAFERVTVKSDADGAAGGRPRPHPLTLATAQQLGVLPTRSVPPLLSHVLPAGTYVYLLTRHSCMPTHETFVHAVLYCIVLYRI